MRTLISDALSDGQLSNSRKQRPCASGPELRYRRAVCSESCTYGSEGGGRKSASHGKSPAPYPTWMGPRKERLWPPRCVTAGTCSGNLGEVVEGFLIRAHIRLPDTAINA